MDIRLLIDGADVMPVSGAMFERRDPFTGKVATRAPAATVTDVDAAVNAAAVAFPAWADTGPNHRRTLLLKAAEVMAAKADEFTRLVIEETGATGPWAGFNVMLAAQMLREAASMTTQIGGEVIPSDKPGCLSLAVRQPAGVVVGIAPWNAPVILGTRAARHAARLRQHRGAQGVGIVSRDAPADRPGVQRGRFPQGRRQCGDQCARRCADDRRGADRPSGGQADQLHRLDPRRAHRRRARRASISSRCCWSSAARRR